MGVQHLTGQGKKAKKIGLAIHAENKLHPYFEIQAMIEPELFLV